MVSNQRQDHYLRVWVEKTPLRRKNFVPSLKDEDSENGGEGLD